MSSPHEYANSVEHDQQTSFSDSTLSYQSRNTILGSVALGRAMLNKSMFSFPKSQNKRFFLSKVISSQKRERKRETRVRKNRAPKGSDQTCPVQGLSDTNFRNALRRQLAGVELPVQQCNSLSGSEQETSNNTKHFFQSATNQTRWSQHQTLPQSIKKHTPTEQC